jgi:hypothetical protein
MFVRMLRYPAMVLLAAAWLGGCQQNQQSPTPVINGGEPAQVDLSGRPGPGLINGQPATPETVLSADPAAGRLQDIGGALLVYYSDHKQLPPTLQDLAGSPGGDSLNLTSPQSGREFVYVPSGLWSDQHPDKVIIAYDPDLHGAQRFCLLMNPPSTGAPLEATVIAIPEPDFRKYHPQAQ